MIRYLCFLLKSGNQHSVHSPFVYSLVTKCLYDRSYFAEYQQIKSFLIEGISRKEKKILCRLAFYFSIKTILVTHQKMMWHHFFKKITSIEEKDTEKVDFLMITSSENIDINELLSKMHNDSILVFMHPHKTKQNRSLWGEIIENEHFIVTIDTFNFGFAFVRKEQLKQHFYIRL